ncbi:TadE family type IV pilus minor pilin [Nesterenkonia populi]|uniref:TadE family type IV pilus minor pilin n=1 Tax=Nesterenkonia populi TaxID=1591087 RepID=UPI0011BE228B|nr:TadE family type IV pilus minor pilin [Nesterenkonia populi]
MSLAEDPGDRGSVTAEFALALPSIVAVLLLVLSLGSHGVQAVALESAAREAARELARGEPAAVVEEAAVRAAGDSVTVTLSPDGAYTRVLLTRPVRIAGLIEVSSVYEAEASALTEHVGGSGR